LFSLLAWLVVSTSSCGSDAQSPLSLGRPKGPYGKLTQELTELYDEELIDLVVAGSGGQPAYFGMVDNGALSRDELTINGSITDAGTSVTYTNVLDYFIGVHSCVDPEDEPTDADGDGIPASETKKISCSHADENNRLNASGKFEFLDTSDSATDSRGLNRGYTQTGSVYSDFFTNNILDASLQLTFAKQVLSNSKKFTFSNDIFAISRRSVSGKEVYERRGRYLTIQVTPTSMGTGNLRDTATILAAGTIHSMVGYVELLFEDIDVILSVAAKSLTYSQADCPTSPHIKDGAVNFEDSKSNVFSITYASCTATYKFNETTFTP
jgi:hypothetical protein